MKEWLATVVSQINNDATPTIYWIGTSMGGLIGSMISSSVDFPILNKMVLNDIGPFVSAKGLERIKEYCGNSPDFGSKEEAATYIKKIFSPMDPLTEDEWDFLIRNSIKQHGERYKMRYDPKLTNQLV